MKYLKAVWQFCCYLFVRSGAASEVRRMMSDGRYRQVGHGTIGLRATSNSDMAACRFLEMDIR